MGTKISVNVLLNRISQWKNTSTLWLHGFWSFDWADNYVKVDTVNLTSSTFTVDKQTPPVYGMQSNNNIVYNITTVTIVAIFMHRI